MTVVQIIFYFFAMIAVMGAVMVVTARHPVRSVLSLVLTFFAMAGIWMLLTAEFLSLILLLVYVGAVMTLFLFVVMMLSVEQEQKRGFVRYWPIALVLLALLLGAVALILIRQQIILPLSQTGSMMFKGSNLRALGDVLYTDYIFPFEVAGTLLLSAMIAAISISYRGPIKRKVQVMNKQLSMQASDAVRLVNMPSEPKRKP